MQRTEYRASAGAAVSTVEKRCYDTASRLTTVASGPPNFMNDDCPATMGPVVFSRFDYGLDANGNRVAQREQRASTDELTDYGYDALDRLVAVAYPSETVLYQLDAVGNRTGEKKTTRAAVQALGLVAAAFAALAPADTLANVRGDFNRADWLTARRTLSANGLSELSRIDFAHDANGNTTSEHSATSLREYTWDSRNTLTAALIDGLDVGRYSYDWQLQRVSRTAGGSTVEYVLDDKLVLQELDGTHAATRRYHFGALSPLGVSDSAGPRWLLNDGLGSVSDEVTPSGALFKQRQYNAWGEYRNSTAPALNEPKLGYEGHQYDLETSLTYARARYLDNRYGVLLSRDAVEGNLNDAPSLHRYTWARVGPLRFLDFEGLAEGDTMEDSIRKAKEGALATKFPDARIQGVPESEIEKTFIGLQQPLKKNLTLSERTVVETREGIVSLEKKFIFLVSLGFAGSGAALAEGLAARAGMGRAGTVALTLGLDAAEGFLLGSGSDSAQQGLEIAIDARQKFSASEAVLTGLEYAGGNVAGQTIIRGGSALLTKKGGSALQSSAAAGQIPKTGVDQFDVLAVETKQFKDWGKNLEKRGYKVEFTELPQGTHGEIEGMTMRIDPEQFTYLDLLHESRHVAQLQMAAELGVGLNKNVRAAFERGAYSYEKRLGKRFGFSDEYQSWAQSRVKDYWTPSVQKKFDRSPTLQSFQETFSSLLH